MPETIVIPTKFPEQDVKIIDKLIQKGKFISRSDLIREATRAIITGGIITTCSDFEIMVKKMKDEGDFNSLEGKVISRLFLDGCEKPLTKEDFNPAEQRTIKRLLKHPFEILKKESGKLLLTKNGLSVAKGYLKGLAHLSTVS